MSNLFEMFDGLQGLIAEDTIDEMTKFGQAEKRVKSKYPRDPHYLQQAKAAMIGGVPVAQKPGASSQDKFKAMLLFYKPLTKEAMQALQQEVNDIKLVLKGIEGLGQGKAIVTVDGYQAIADASAELKKVYQKLSRLGGKLRSEVKKGSR